MTQENKELNIKDVPYRNRKEFRTGKGQPRSPVTYCFDDDGNELGYYIPALDLDNTGRVNTSTAGRKWSDNLKKELY